MFAFTFNPYRRAAIFPDAPVPEVVAEQFEILSHVPLVTPQDSHDLYGQIAATSEAKRNYALGWDAVVAVRAEPSLHSSTSRTPARMYDVIIAGSGLAGSLLGSILARHDAKVLLIDAGRHPRFAIGESTVRDTTKMLTVLADAFDVPEIQSLSGFLEVDHKVTRRCGLKRNFGFTYHEEGQAQDP